MKNVIGVLAATGLCAGVASAGDIETRFVISDDTGAVLAMSGDPDLVVAPGTSGTLFISFQATTNAPEGLGFAAIRGSLNVGGLGAGDSTDNAALAFGGAGAVDLSQPFAAAQLSVLSQPPGPADPATNGQGVFIDIVTFEFTYDAQDGEVFTFDYDPTNTPQGQPDALIITAWNQQPGPPLIPPDFFLFSPTTRQGNANASRIQIITPAPSALAAIGLGGLVASRRRR